MSVFSFDCTFRIAFYPEKHVEAMLHCVKHAKIRLISRIFNSTINTDLLGENATLILCHFILVTRKDKDNGNESEKIDYYCFNKRVLVERMVL